MAARQEAHAAAVKALIALQFEQVGIARAVVAARIEVVRQEVIRRILGIPADSFSIAQLRLVEGTLRTSILLMADDVSQEIAALISQSAQNAVEKILKPLAAAGFTTLPAIQISQNLVNTAARFSANLVRIESLEAIAAIGDIVRSAVLLGQTPAQAIAAIGSLLPGSGPFSTLNARAEAILRTESLTIFSIVSEQQLQNTSSIIPGMRKLWLHTGLGVLDPRLNHLRFNGTIIAVKERFMMPGRKGGIVPMRFPRDPLAPAEEVVNCACTVEEVFPDETEAEALGLNDPQVLFTPDTFPAF